MTGIKVTHISTVKNFDGLYDFTVLVSGGVKAKEYTYTLKTGSDVEQTLRLIQRGYAGRVMVYLKKVALKEVEHG